MSCEWRFGINKQRLWVKCSFVFVGVHCVLVNIADMCFRLMKLDGSLMSFVADSEKDAQVLPYFPLCFEFQGCIRDRVQHLEHV